MTVANLHRKYEHSRTFGLINSATANVEWTGDNHAASTSSKITGAGKAIVPANEEVFVWDLKKGELLGRWRDGNCNAQVSAIAQSNSDPDIFAVG
jgi:U3 small nucleolar RNA-associated protein 12